MLFNIGLALVFFPMLFVALAAGLWGYKVPKDMNRRTLIGSSIFLGAILMVCSIVLSIAKWGFEHLL